MKLSIIVVFGQYRQTQFDLNTKEVQANCVRGDAVKQKVASNFGVVGLNPKEDCPFCKIFRTAKTDASCVYIPTKTDQNDEKKLQSFDGYWRSKNQQNPTISVNPTKFLVWIRRNSQVWFCTLKGLLFESWLFNRRLTLSKKIRFPDLMEKIFRNYRLSNLSMLQNK